MIDDSINHEYIIRYLRDTFKEKDPVLCEMRSFAKEFDVPIAEPETAAFLSFLCSVKKPKRILEVGTAIGYSAIVMAKACDAEIVTLERNEEMFRIASDNIKKASLSHRIEIVFGDACETIYKLDGQFDLVFIDASKAHYREFFENSMLSDKGVLVFDNVLFKGMTATDELVQRRKITIVKRLRSFVQDLCSDDRYSTSLLPLGDGVLLAYRK